MHIFHKHKSQVENSETSETLETSNFFPDFFSSDFLILTQYQKSKTRAKKTRKKNSEVSEVSDVSNFSICHFLDFLIKYPKFKFQFR